MSTGLTWTSERDEALRDAWTNTTVTAPEIAKAMGGFEHTADGGKNAVIGRARRLGLTRKDKDKAMTDTQRAAIVKAKESAHSRKSYLKKLAAENKSPREPKPEPCHDQTRTAAKLTEEQIETRRQQGRRAGYASIKKRGLVMARTLAATTSPILDFEARV